MSYFYILLTILLTVFGQLVIKWQVSKVGALPDGSAEKVWFLLSLVLNPWVLTAFFAALLASVTWMAAMTKLELSHGYPLMSLSFVLVVLLSAVFFNEPITTLKVVGVALVVVGVAVGSRG
jgi:multidrug transporter EmrE-like cation transporter